jgi:predicted RNA-binding Zn-ribbon protein involved in translation (DUF1610 family)
MDKDKLKKYCEDGLSSYKIAKLENVSSTNVIYWLKKYQLSTKGWFAFNKDELIKIVAESKSHNEILTKLNKNNSSNSYRSLKRATDRYNIDVSHLMNSSDALKLRYREKYISNEKLFVANSKTSRGTIKKRIIDDDLLKYRCVKCGQDENWNNEKLTLILDHKNGIRNDHRLENLRFVCPNCNSQLSTHCRKKHASVAQLD